MTDKLDDPAQWQGPASVAMTTDVSRIAFIVQLPGVEDRRSLQYEC